MPWWLYVVGIIGLLVVLEHLCKRYFSAAQEPWNARGKVVVITGASSGIGESLALKFAKEGSRLALCARRVEKLDSVKAASLSAGAADVITVQCDVSKEEDCKSFISKTAEHFGRIDCLILNAGVSQNLLAENAKDSSLYHQLMQTNYFGSVYCTLAALPHIKRNWGAKIAIISSGIAKISCPSRTGYAGSKWALHGFFDALRMELCRKYGTTITIICPPTVATEINNHRLGDQSFQTPDMSSDECAAISYNAIINHQREELFLPLLKYASPLKPIFPWLMDFVTVQKLKRLKIFDENAVRVPVDDTPASTKLE